MFKRTRARAADALESYDDDVATREAAAAKGTKPKTDVLGILRALKDRSIGFDNDKELNEERADALDYYKGKHEGAISRDLPVPAGRSTVVSTDVANAVEAALPDIVEIFVGGDDVITFKPQGLEDIEAARQETDYVRHIIFQQNRGFWIFYTGIKDALISKTGIFHFYWDGTPEYDEYQTKATEPQIDQIIEQGNELVKVEPAGTVTAQGFPQFHVTFRTQTSDGHVVIKNVAPENFTVAPETVILADTNYCAMEVSETRQALVDIGYDRADVMKLGLSDGSDDEDDARDTTEESQDRGSDGEGDHMLELVDIVVHYVRLHIPDEDDSGDGKAQIWRIVTDKDGGIELEREKRSRIEFSAITPYPMTHRFYGQSLADKTIQTQKWKTSVSRTGNDHLYFANNQRQEVKRAGIIPDVTIQQLVDNTPGQPVVTEDGNSLRPIQNGSLGIDVLALLGYISADNEERTGIARNTMGLPSDSMHETKGGNEKLISLSQKRHRMMARLFAETGIRDLFIGVHDIARSNATMKDTIELRGEWVDIAPSSWRRRKDATIDIGIGSGGQEQDLAGTREYRGFLSELVQAQGGYDADDALVTRQNVYDFSQSYADKLKLKGGRLFVNDPKKIDAKKAAEAAMGLEAPPEVPPEVQQAQMELKLEEQTQAAKLALATKQAETQAQIDLIKIKEKGKLDREQMMLDMQLQRERSKQEADLAREKAQSDQLLAREKAQFEADLAEINATREYKIALMQTKLKAENDRENVIQKNRPGGELDK